MCTCSYPFEDLTIVDVSSRLFCFSLNFIQIVIKVRFIVNTLFPNGYHVILFYQGADSPDQDTYSLLPISQTSVQDLQALVDKISKVKDKFEQVWEKHQNFVLQSLQFTFFEKEFLSVSIETEKTSACVFSFFTQSLDGYIECFVEKHF